MEDQLLLVFGDEYVCLGVDIGHEAGDDEITETCLEILSFWDEALIQNGVVTAEEIAQARAGRTEQARRVKEAIDRQEYERLRRKFESAST